jgi:hypothetical protein
MAGFRPGSVGSNFRHPSFKRRAADCVRYAGGPPGGGIPAHTEIQKGFQGYRYPTADSWGLSRVSGTLVAYGQAR